MCSDDVSCQPNVDCEWGERHEWNSWPSCNVTCGDGEEAKKNTLFFVYFGGDHSMSDYIGKGVIDTRCSRFLIGKTLSKNGNRCLHEDGA